MNIREFINELIDYEREGWEEVLISPDPEWNSTGEPQIQGRDNTLIINPK